MLYPPDAGTFSPYEHGEVYVLDDGGEVDLDLGNYERFLNVSLSRDNNITTGNGRELHIDTHRQTHTKTGREARTSRKRDTPRLISTSATSTGP